MAKKPTKDMVGTPKGYVKKKDVERVDRNMRPILKGATAALSALPVGRAAKAAHMVAKDLGTYRALGAASAGAGIAGGIDYAGRVVDAKRKAKAKTPQNRKSPNKGK